MVSASHLVEDLLQEEAETEGAGQTQEAQA